MPSEELWAEVFDFPNYAVSSRGTVLSKRSGRKLTPTQTRDGHLRVTLSDGGRVRQIYLRRLVAQAFHPDYHDGAIVKNQNGDRSDCSIGNIYVRPHDPKPLRFRRQEAWGRRIHIRELDMDFVSVRAAARYIGGDYSAIYRCLRGGRGKHLGYSFEYIEEHA